MSPLTQKILELVRPEAVKLEDGALLAAVRLWRSAGCPDLPPEDGDFGGWLSRCRRGRGGTLHAVSGAMGITPSRLSRIESGIYVMSAQEWVLICAELHLTPEERARGERLLMAGAGRPR